MIEFCYEFIYTEIKHHWIVFIVTKVAKQSGYLKFSVGLISSLENESSLRFIVAISTKCDGTKIRVIIAENTKTITWNLGLATGF